MARKNNILPLLAIGGIVGAVVLMGGKKKRSKAQPAPGPAPVSPGPLGCADGDVPYDRVEPGTGGTYTFKKCIPAEMYDDIIAKWGQEVSITEAEIEAYKQGDRSMFEGDGKESPEVGTGFTPGVGPVTPTVTPSVGPVTPTFTPSVGSTTASFVPNE